MLRIHALALLLATVAALATTSAHAVQRTFVASFGADANTAANCSLALPCRGFAAAQTVTDNNGEIIVLDSAGYGAVTITKSISIIAPAGVYGGISVFSGASGVSINASGVNVVLRGLTINGQGGLYGVNMSAGSKLTVENCVISNLMFGGILVNTDAVVRITDSTIRDNAGTGIQLANGARSTITRAVVSGNTGVGVYANSDNASTVTADVADSTLDGNLSGVGAVATFAFAVVKVSVRDSRVSRNSNYGVYGTTSTGAIATVSASNNNITLNGFVGIASFGAGTKIWASANMVSENSTGFFRSAGLFESAGNNAVRNNSLDTSGTITPVATQ